MIPVMMKLKLKLRNRFWIVFWTRKGGAYRKKNKYYLPVPVPTGMFLKIPYFHLVRVNSYI